MNTCLNRTPSLALALLGSALGSSPLHAADWPSPSLRLLSDWPWEMRATAVPALNISQTDKAYLVEAQLPGLKREDIDVTIESGILTISGERKQTQEDKNASYRLQEVTYGSFSRSVSLPRDADPNKVKAEFKDGLLTLRIERNEALQPKKITIQ